MTILLIFAFTIISALTLVAGYYLLKLQKATKVKSIQTQKNHQAWLDHQNELIKDIKFIANSMSQEQCEITEGCMRLAYLINKVDDTDQIKNKFPHIYSHYNATMHMPIKDEYKALTRKQQFKIDCERRDLENTNKTAVLSDTQNLANHIFS